MRQIFILRPEPGASASAERARTLGMVPVVAPLFTIEPIAWTAPNPARFDALLLTSANAVRCAGGELEGLRSLSVYAVGEATADAARSAGFDMAAVGEAGVDSLLRSAGPGLRLLHLCGTHRKEADSAAQDITAVPVYRAGALPRPAALDQLWGAVAAVHSPRAGARLAELMEERARASVRIAAISAAAAAAVGTGWERVEAAAAPSDEALLALAAWLCEEGGG